jgi:hypothetical protein
MILWPCGGQIDPKPHPAGCLNLVEIDFYLGVWFHYKGLCEHGD